MSPRSRRGRTRDTHTTKYELIEGSKSTLPPGTVGALKGVGSYVKKDGTIEPRGHFVPDAGGPGTTISMRYLKRKN